MKYSLTLFIFLSALIPSIGQDLKPNDYAALYARNGIKTRICKEVRFEGTEAKDSSMVGVAEFDRQGRMTRYTEFFAKGKKMAEYTYAYDNSGKMIASTVALVFNNWVPLDFTLTYDSKGRVISRELKESVANFWKKETFTYSSGVLIKSEQWYEVNGGLAPTTHKDYPASLEPNENSLTYIHDNKGLLRIYQLFGRGGKAERAWYYTYETY